MFLYFFKYNKSLTDCNSLRGGHFLGTPNYHQIRLSTCTIIVRRSAQTSEHLLTLHGVLGLFK